MLVVAIREYLRCSGPDENEEEYSQELLDQRTHEPTLHV